MDRAATASLKECDFFCIDASGAFEKAFLRDIFFAVFRKMQDKEGKERVAIHYRLGRRRKLSKRDHELRASGGGRVWHGFVEHRLYVLIDPPLADMPTKKRVVDVRNKTIAVSRRREEVLRQVNRTERAILFIYDNKELANVYIMDQQFAFRVSALARPCACARAPR